MERRVNVMSEFIKFFDELSKEDVSLVGGKNANLGEMISKANVPVPFGFAITAKAYQYFIEKNNLYSKISVEMKRLTDINDTKTLQSVGKNIREMIEGADIPEDLEQEIKESYRKLAEKIGIEKPFVAVRSSATAEDLPGASFAGQQETYLNVRGEEELIEKTKKCFASLFTDRAIFYRIEKGFDWRKVSLSVGVQKMVNSKAAGVMFTLDVRNGDTSKIVIEGAWGLGEYIVQGTVTPDHWLVDKETMKIVETKISDKPIMLLRAPGGGNIEQTVMEDMRRKPCLTDEQVIELARYGKQLEEHYQHAEDIEWALDADENKLYIIQCRPETFWSERKGTEAKVITKAEAVLTGLAASPGVGIGAVKKVIELRDLSKVQKGDVLVTKMTTPDMVPAMEKASAIVTDEGGSTSHAAIVSRELGIPCVVGTGEATKKLNDGEIITVDGSSGKVYLGKLEIEAREEEDYSNLPETKTKIYVNLGIPGIAEKIAKRPVDGVGLMREEFILATYVKEHPLALIEQGRQQFFIDKLAEGIEKVVKAFNPRPVILRFSDFKTNEYRELKGGEKFEPHEDNPMLGWRGCSRYVSPKYKDAFVLELEAVKKVRAKGYKNLWVMLPFPRTVKEVVEVEKIMEEHGLKRGEDLKLILMAEIPSNIFLADKFSEHCDGFSIGSNDLTQLILGVDRDSEILGKMGYFDERNEAVLRAIEHLIKTAHEKGKIVGICGQAPSNYPDFARFLVKCGIDSISVNPDVIAKTRRIVAEAEKELGRGL
ncbi:phosphoenolpyruvate synthase [Candidatus Micrarchaeota archaeon]|nr:MAG: phosphoenolpyruvate synthase [Candidatus Micrarchaeota archaeon]